MKNLLVILLLPGSALVASAVVACCLGVALPGWLPAQDIFAVSIAAGLVLVALTDYRPHRTLPPVNANFASARHVTAAANAAPDVALLVPLHASRTTVTAGPF